jgi:hypothetical protein
MRTPEQMREYLTQKLLLQHNDMVTANRYYTNTQPLQFMDPDVARVLQNRIKALSVNYARLVVDVLESRLQVVGFSTSPGSVSDAALWNIWQANDLDEQSQQAHLDALIYGRAFFLAWVGADGRAQISAESPLQCSIHRDPATRKTIGAIKRWLDDDGRTHALLFTRDVVVEYLSRSRTDTTIFPNPRPDSFIDDAYDEVSRQRNPLGVVPMVALVNRPRLEMPDGESELTDVMPLVDAIAKLSTDLMVAAEYSASPRRWVTGVAPDMQLSTEQANNLALKIEQVWEKAHASRFLIAPNDKTEFGQFDVASLNNYQGAIQLLTAQIAALAALPPSYLSLLNSQPTSADAIRSSEARLTAKAVKRQRDWSGAYEQLMRIASTIENGRPDPSLQDMQTMWRSAEPSTIAQTADAESKLFAAGIIDQRAALTELGYAPQDVQRIENATTGAPNA